MIKPYIHSFGKKTSVLPIQSFQMGRVNTIPHERTSSDKKDETKGHTEERNQITATTVASNYSLPLMYPLRYDKRYVFLKYQCASTAVIVQFPDFIC